MKLIVKTCVLAALLLSLNSCGLPGAVGRTVGRAYQGLDEMAASARN
jgi:hypothetical protein